MLTEEIFLFQMYIIFCANIHFSSIEHFLKNIGIHHFFWCLLWSILVSLLVILLYTLSSSIVIVVWFASSSSLMVVLLIVVLVSLTSLIILILMSGFGIHFENRFIKINILLKERHVLNILEDVDIIIPQRIFLEKQLFD